MERTVPDDVKKRVREVITILREKGLEFEAQLAAANRAHYDFMRPKSPHYRFYTHQLSQYGPPPRERVEQSKKKASTTKIQAEGTIETISVGAMSELVREQSRQGKREYEPCQPEHYERVFQVAVRHPHLDGKVQDLIEKYGHLTAIPKRQVLREVKGDPFGPEMMEEVRRETGAGLDCSMGGFGGKKYEGLGVRDVKVQRVRSTLLFGGRKA